MTTNPEYKNKRISRSRDKTILYYRNKRSLKEELIGVLKRLEKDTGSYLANAESNGYTFGYFAMLRLLVPTIEHLSQVLPNKKGINSKNNLLVNLGISFPNIFFHIYRHSLVHGDEPIQIETGLQIITWHLTFGHNQHRAELVGYPVKTYNGKRLPPPIVVYIDLKKLYEDLVKLIQQNIETAHDNDYTWIQTSKRFLKSKAANKAILDEVEILKTSTGGAQ